MKQRLSLKKSLARHWQYLLIGFLAAALMVTALWGLHANDEASRRSQSYGGPRNGQTSHDTNDMAAHLEEHGITPLTATEASNSQKTAEELTYLIEEEKLAHDVYQAMFDRWGARVFNNIQNSEVMHQDMVWAVMKSRNLEDPRTKQAGTYTNPDLQAFYDKLIAQGSQSRVEAYKVGVLIEQTDIADLKTTIANLDPKDNDVKATLENLLHASENHLRAFNRQLGQ